MSDLQTNNTATKTYGSKKATKELPEGVHPLSALWYTKTGGIEALSSDEQIVLNIDYRVWAEKKPEEAGKYDIGAYCRYRQRCHALKVARHYASAPS